MPNTNNANTLALVDITSTHEVPRTAGGLVEYMLEDVPTYGDRRRRIHDIETSDLHYAREGEMLSDALDSLADQVGWTQVQQQQGRPVEALSTKDRAASFATWVADNYPDPGVVANEIRAQQIRQSQRSTAYTGRHKSQPVSEGIARGLFRMDIYSEAEQAQAWDAAFDIIYGKRWRGYKKESHFNFKTDPHNTDPLEIESNLTEARRIFTRQLGKRERVAIQRDTSPVLTAGEMAERFGIHAELRGIMYLGDVGSGGVALAIIDTRDNPRNEHGMTNRAVFNNRPLWEAEPGLVLVPAKIKAFDPNRTVKIPADASWPELELTGVPTVVGFSEEYALPLGNGAGEVMLGREPDRDQAEDNVLPEMFPNPHVTDEEDYNHSISSTVSRRHCAIRWWADGMVEVVNLGPHNDTLVETAHVSRSTAEAMALKSSATAGLPESGGRRDETALVATSIGYAATGSVRRPPVEPAIESAVGESHPATRPAFPVAGSANRNR